MASDFDVVVVGSGPNGLAAAIRLQQEGLRVLLLEGHSRIGGGLRSAELTLPGFMHDVCSAVHPLAVSSPFFKSLSLEGFGLEYIYPPLSAAHPFDDRPAAILKQSLEETTQTFPSDGRVYSDLMEPLIDAWPKIEKEVLGPLRFPVHPSAMLNFGLKALRSAEATARRFISPEARGFWAGMAAHSLLPLAKPATSAIALVLLISGHIRGWPIPRRGSMSIAEALAACFSSLGGQIQTGEYIHSLKQLPSSQAVVFDCTPRQVLRIAGPSFSSLYRWQLQRYRYGMGVFKMDWALSDPIPFADPACRMAGTVHIGNTWKEIAASEVTTWRGRHSEKPFIILSQPSIFDPTRAPAGRHTAWAYCHVPNGSERNMTRQIENQIERFAPGFKTCILARHVFTPIQLEEYNPNYVGGDINGGAADLTQLFTRPALRLSPYRTSAKGIYLCSSSTPPGGGVHGMCGYHAAVRILKDIFHQKPEQA